MKRKTVRLKKNHSLPEDIFNPLLQNLEIFGDTLERIDERFEVLRQLESLTIISKNLKEINANIFYLPHLRQLKIKGGMFTTLPELQLPSNIKTLFCTDSTLAELPETIYQLVNLEILVISGNQLTTLPKNLTLLKNLRRLVIDNNRLQTFNFLRSDFPRLNHLSLDNNPLTPNSKELLLNEFNLHL